MGSRSQIENRDGNRRGLTYTCNCGWLDLGHMDPTSPQPFVGASDLWRQLRDATTATHCAYILSSTGPVAAPPTPTYLPAEDDGTCYEPGLLEMGLGGISRPFFGPGFIVNYSQQVPARLGYHGRYLVRPRLTEELKKRIALTIMLRVSFAFEDLQHTADWLGIASGSGYAADDLTANVIGLLIAMGEVTLEEALASCHEVSKDAALYLWDNRERGLHREYINPILHSDTRVPGGSNQDGTTMMIDECAGQPRRPPEFLTRIQPLSNREARTYFTDMASSYGLPRSP
ncbi:hypothetical protein [Roseibium sp. Sym1]|uniref:hypothetical protein n=1 Tax=Roseibium sp. Sym1 TaxID=3016006 RepID=UPI0022B3033E|nr:hypothetical protein [Roseibium sp. Sym1]